MPEINPEERHTAGKRIKVYRLHNPGYQWKRDDGTIARNPTEEDMIQEMADQGYNFAGLIDKYIPTGIYGSPSYNYLFIKADGLDPARDD